MQVFWLRSDQKKHGNGGMAETCGNVLLQSIPLHLTTRSPSLTGANCVQFHAWLYSCAWWYQAFCSGWWFFKAALYGVEWLSEVLKKNQAVTASNSKGKMHIQISSNHFFFFFFSSTRDKELELQMEKTRHLVRTVRVDYISWWRILSQNELKFGFTVMTDVRQHQPCFFQISLACVWKTRRT